jgi:hypothetical protein
MFLLHATFGNLYQLAIGGEMMSADFSSYPSKGRIEITGAGLPGSGGAITLPPFIWYEDKAIRNMPLDAGYGGVQIGEIIPAYLHEWMHPVQGRKYGPTYLVRGLCSIWKNLFSIENNCLIEMEANEMARGTDEYKRLNP